MSLFAFSGALEAILQRNTFYYQSYRKSMLHFFMLVLLIIFLILFNILAYKDTPNPIYFATTASDAILDLPPLTQRNVSDAELRAWVEKALLASYNYNFVNYRQVFQNARIYFTPQGHNRFLKAIKESLNLNRVQKEKLLFASIITNISIENQGQLESGTYYWDLKIPMKVALMGGRETKYEPYNWVVSVKVIRISALQNTSGLGIAQVIVREG